MKAIQLAVEPPAKGYLQFGLPNRELRELRRQTCRVTGRTARYARIRHETRVARLTSLLVIVMLYSALFLTLIQAW